MRIKSTEKHFACKGILSVSYSNIINILVSFIQLQDFMIYQQLVNKRTKILSLVTSHIPRLCNQSIHVYALLNSTPRLKSIDFIKMSLNLRYFCKKIQFFERRRLRQTPETASTPLQISGYAPDTRRVLLVLESYCENL